MHFVDLDVHFVVDVCFVAYNRKFMHYLLMYDVVKDYVERRAPLRVGAHRAGARGGRAR